MCTDNLAVNIFLILFLCGNIACFIITTVYIFGEPSGNPGYYYKINNNNNYQQININVTNLNQTYYDCCSDFYDCVCQYEIGKPNCYYNYIHYISGRCTDFNMLCSSSSSKYRYSIDYGSCTLNCGTCSNSIITFSYNNKNISYNTNCGVNDQRCFNKFKINKYYTFYINKYNEVIEKLYMCENNCTAVLFFSPFSFLVLIIYAFSFYRMCCYEKPYNHNTRRNRDTSINATIIV